MNLNKKYKNTEIIHDQWVITFFHDFSRFVERQLKFVLKPSHNDSCFIIVKTRK